MPFRQVSRSEIQEPFSRLWNLEYPDDLRSPNEIETSYRGIIEGSFEEHWVEEEGGRLLTAVSAYDWHGTTPPERITADFCLDAEHEKSTLPETFDFFESLTRRAQGKSFCLWTSDRSADRLSFLDSRGYRLKQTVPVTRLDLQAFDPSQFEDRIASLLASKLRIVTVAELDDDGFDWIPALYDATWELLQDMPQAHPPRQIPLDQYRRLFEQRTEAERRLMFVVMDEDRIVGYSRLEEAGAMPGLVRTGMSGTARSHRRRGVVTSLKATTLKLAKERGYTLAQTDNDVTNPMYQLNLQLGFKNCWNWLMYERTI